MGKSSYYHNSKDARGHRKILEEVPPAEVALDELVVRVETTLNLVHRWGYAPRVEDLARQLIGGPAPVELVAAAVRASNLVRVDDGFVVLAGHETLLDESRFRTSRNETANGEARRLAQEFAEALARVCPFVESVGLSGSVASGGYTEGDDIDFDLFVKDGTKYTVYLIANVLGLRYSLRHRRRSVDPQQKIVFLPKVVCINVVWPAAETKPFSRQDPGLAFELLRCEPLVGTERFAEVLSGNPWIDRYLPQARTRRWVTDLPAMPNRTSRLLARLYARPWSRWLLERLSRGISYAMYRVAQELRHPDARARERMEFLRRAKYPYEVFQD